ncbi:MAG: UDP-N-acetylmuramate dehydrogenase [Candidatus Omnitrophica bacterium]|nr:UDP-N-acetylmuramate dehydrogenase [Candidatus Omnitrophota bacterium]
MSSSPDQRSKPDLSFLTDAGINVTYNAPLAQFTTFKLGGPCKAMVECANAGHMTVAVLALRSLNIPFIVMGFGSNILASDNGVDVVIVRYTNNTPIIRQEGNTLIVDAATQLDALAEYAINAGLTGMTEFSGIPGTVGGAIAGNAGAYGAQISTPLINLTLLKPDNSVVTVSPDTLHFEYRDSAIKHCNDIILSATFTLSPGDTATMRAKRVETINTRETKHGRWQDTPCAGSFFRNVEPTSKADRRQAAGGIIEMAGARNLKIGGAHSYKNHANIITRDNGATAKDVFDLTKRIVEIVNQRSGINLVREVRLLGTFDGMGDAKNFW